MLFNFLYKFQDRALGFNIEVETVDADSIDDAIRIFILGDDIYTHYINDIIGFAAYGIYELYDEKIQQFAGNLINRFNDITDLDILEQADLTEAEREYLIRRYKEIIDENLDDIATFISMLQETVFFKIKPINRILTGPRFKSATKI